MRRFIFKVALNVENHSDVEAFLQNINQYICLQGLLPESPLGFCIGVVDFVIDDTPVALSLFMVNEKIKRPWVRFGAYEIDADIENLSEQLLNTAEQLLSAGS